MTPTKKIDDVMDTIVPLDPVEPVVLGPVAEIDGAEEARDDDWLGIDPLEDDEIDVDLTDEEKPE
jgi:hypothetical protein